LHFEEEEEARVENEGMNEKEMFYEPENVVADADGTINSDDSIMTELLFTAPVDAP